MDKCIVNKISINFFHTKFISPWYTTPNHKKYRKGIIPMNKKSPYQVLFLEDEPTIREVLTEYMLISGYQVVSVPNGDEAIAHIDAEKYDIAILDIMVPGADGFSVLSAFGKHSRKWQ